MTSVAHLVVVMGTQFFDASGSGSSDYPVTDLLQMMGRASRPNIDDSGEGWAGMMRRNGGAGMNGWTEEQVMHRRGCDQKETSVATALLPDSSALPRPMFIHRQVCAHVPRTPQGVLQEVPL